MREVSLTGVATNGAGIYGYSAPSHVTKCRHSNNPNGHNPECPCGWANQPLIWDDEEVA